MPALANPKHEQFIRNLVTEPTQKDAYLKTFPTVTEETAKTNSSRLLLSNAQYKNRFLELLEEQQAGIGQITRRYVKFLNDDDNPSQSWDAVKTGLKIHGVIDDEKNMQNNQDIQISINIIRPSEKSIDVKCNDTNNLDITG